MTTMVDALQLTLYIAAASEDLIEDAPNHWALKSIVLPAMERYTAMEIDESDVMDIVDSVMGTGWKPSGEWKNQLDVLGFTRGTSGK